jgi:hypothetical protein
MDYPTMVSIVITFMNRRCFSRIIQPASQLTSSLEFISRFARQANTSGCFRPTNHTSLCPVSAVLRPPRAKPWSTCRIAGQTKCKSDFFDLYSRFKVKMGSTPHRSSVPSMGRSPAPPTGGDKRSIECGGFRGWVSSVCCLF